MQDKTVPTYLTESPQHLTGTDHTIPHPAAQHIIVVRSTSYHFHQAGNVNIGANYGLLYQTQVDDLTTRGNISRDQDALRAMDGKNFYSPDDERARLTPVLSNQGSRMKNTLTETRLGYATADMTLSTVL
ncbi:hypothetical protein DFP72DRAFT_1173027 [Ephemerocybe angulata]|uniref:Uncharacterized protein n=1 Tax=Ephemerocybe angulata TaxID=980116 RepID=A0A8H6M0S6_9AGAR|nr:hypothetical protein DFP72DRAFT_1173027 [Tulosesus angulatus]